MLENFKLPASQLPNFLAFLRVGVGSKPTRLIMILWAGLELAPTLFFLIHPHNLSLCNNMPFHGLFQFCLGGLLKIWQYSV
jgi:hypothetical protein